MSKKLLTFIFGIGCLVSSAVVFLVGVIGVGLWVYVKSSSPLHVGTTPATVNYSIQTPSGFNIYDWLRINPIIPKSYYINEHGLLVMKEPRIGEDIGPQLQIALNMFYDPSSKYHLEKLEGAPNRPLKNSLAYSPRKIYLKI